MGEILSFKGGEAGKNIWSLEDQEETWVGGAKTKSRRRLGASRLVTNMVSLIALGNWENRGRDRVQKESIGRRSHGM